MTPPSFEELQFLHANICQALGDPKRLLILYALHAHPRNVTTLADDLDMPQPTASRHLRVLRQRGLVTGDRDGPSVVYTLRDTRIIDVLDTMRQVMRDVVAQQADLVA